MGITVTEGGRCAAHAPLCGASCKKKAWTRIQAFSLNLAVREGFEPSIHFRVYTLSRRAPSATRTPHHIFLLRNHRCNGALLLGVGQIRSRIISVFLFVRSSRVHFAENCGERQGGSHERARTSGVRFVDNRRKWESRSQREGDALRTPLSAVHHAKKKPGRESRLSL